MNVRKTVLIGVVGASALMGASCGGSPATSTATVTGPSESGGPSAAATATTTTTTTTTTTAAHVWVFGDEWTHTSASGAQGSGCAPGAGKFPDGAWFGFAKSWSTSQIAFDLACWYSGAAGEAQAAAHGTEFTNDYFVTNDNTTVRLVTVAGDIPAKKAAWDDGVFKLSQVMVDPGGTLPTSALYPAWIFVNGGVVTELEVQYVP
ncbi:MAG TPA: hypothetical protein VF362_03585 [Demequinaceae bacterium]